jgi:hypothetical protein
MNRTSVYTAYIIEIIDIFKQGGAFGETAGGKPARTPPALGAKVGK